MKILNKWNKLSQILKRNDIQPIDCLLESNLLMINYLYNENKARNR